VQIRAKLCLFGMIISGTPVPVDPSYPSIQVLIANNSRLSIM
jgi:hypothetical protein